MSKYIKLEDAIEYACKAHISGCVGDRIKAQLESLPTIEVSEDAISRQGLLFAIEPMIKEWEGTFTVEGMEKVKTIIETIPSVVPSRPKGEWIEGETIYFCGEQHFPMKCSVCGRTALNEPWHFCPNCGAEMNDNKGE